MDSVMTVWLVCAAVREVLRARPEGIPWGDPSREKVRVRDRCVSFAV